MPAHNRLKNYKHLQYYYKFPLNPICDLDNFIRKSSEISNNIKEPIQIKKSVHRHSLNANKF